MKFRKSLYGATLIGALLVSGVSTAQAATQYPAEGGTWNYGLSAWTPTAFSNYIVNRTHGSSVKTSYGEVRSIDVIAGKWSTASKVANPWGNSYYYRVK